MTTSPPSAPRCTPRTLDLSRWWQIVYRYCQWQGRPLQDENHPPATPEFLCLPNRWQQTVFVNLGPRHDDSHVAAGDDRVWCNAADPADGGDGRNGFLVQLSDQRCEPTRLGVVACAGDWLVSAVVPPTGIGVVLQILGSANQPDGDACLMIASARQPAPGSPVPGRPELQGSWLALKFDQAGTFTAAPMTHPPAFPA